jgi:hypothetical protein
MSIDDHSPLDAPETDDMVDGIPVDRLVDYLDAGRTPRDPAIEVVDETVDRDAVDRVVGLGGVEGGMVVDAHRHASISVIRNARARAILPRTVETGRSRASAMSAYE